MIKNFLQMDTILEFFASGPYRRAVIQGLFKRRTAVVYYPYGMTANVPAENLSFTYKILNQESNLVTLPNDPNTLEPLEGEVIFYNPVTLSSSRYKSDGEILNTAPLHHFIGDMLIEGDVHVIGDMLITGDLEVTGDVDFSGAGATIVHDTVNIGKTHIHSQANDGAGDAEADTGVPHS